MEFVREKTFKRAVELTKDVDEFDIPFIALAIELDTPLWTGDKKLIMGLKNKEIDWVFTTNIISEMRDKE